MSKNPQNDRVYAPVLHVALAHTVASSGADAFDISWGEDQLRLSPDKSL